MSSGRVLGRGRVLGTQRQPAPTAAVAARLVLPSSDSSTSLASSVSTSTAHDASTAAAAGDRRGSVDVPQRHDLSSHVSLGLPDNAATADASQRIICPICNEQMVTLLQLNRHLDDAHQNLEEVQQDEVKNWFQEQVDKAKKLPALAVLEKKFKALDVFESNGVVAAAGPSQSGSLRPAANGTRSTSPAGTTATEPVVARPRDPEEEVTRRHWQRATYNDVCADTLCDKRLGGSNGSVNCRCCGKLFCDDHTMYQMKLSTAAKHDPVRGIWCRVCETCYKSRDGYNDNKGFERQHTDHFLKMRRGTVDRLHLETSRLEKRLTRLTQLLTDPARISANEGFTGVWNLVASGKSQQKVLEQSVIAWQDDATVPNCPFCHQEFSNYAFRRHHCRLCGRVVCGDQQTECSSLVGLNVAAEKGSQTLGLDVRMCKDCKHTLFSKADFAREIQLKPPDQRSYENLVQFERGIRLLLPKFHRLLVALQDPDRPPSQAQINDATKVRKRLTDSFIQYETAARRIRDFVTSSPTQHRLQRAVYQQASNFLHINMLPLKSLPKILKHASPHGAAALLPGSKLRPLAASTPLSNGLRSPSGTSTPTRPSHTTGALAAIKFADRLQHHHHHDATGTSSNRSSSALESLEAEERQLRERVMVLEEQKFIVTEMLARARKARRFEEMGALSANVDELTREIDGMRARIDRVEGDFEGLFAGE